MAEEFQAGICGGNWWNNSRSVLSAAAASPCSMLGLNHDVAGFGWSSNNNNNNKARSNSSGDTNNSVCESPNMAYQEVLQKPHQTDCGNLLIDSTLQMMGFGLSPSDLTHSHNLIRNSGRSESTNMNNMYSILQEDMGLFTKLNSGNHQVQAYSANNNNNSYGYNSETLLQSFFEEEINQPLQQQSHSNNNNNYISNYVPNNNNTSINPNVNNNSWPRNNNIPAANYKQLQFSNNAPFWNAAETVMTSNASDHNNNNNNDNNNIQRSSLSLNNFHSVPQQYATPTFEPKPKCNNNLTATKSNMVCNEDQAQQDSRSTCVKKNLSNGNEQPVIKRARIETPSPLPTFKVRKEKLGDRITALQQLVSPFGKTDTASVLHEAIEYIKFLHDQVSLLSTPYLKNGASSVQVPQKGSNKIKNQGSPNQDLKSRGLCLVPMSSTFPVANETTADFWTPTFGGNFR